MMRFASVVAAVTLLASAGCASSSYMGISLNPGEAAPELQSLARRAKGGDKQARLDLGIRFEEGKGVPKNKVQAIKLYRQAAADSGGTMWVYSPPVRKGDRGTVIPIDRGAIRGGLVEAKARLSALQAKE